MKPLIVLDGSPTGVFANHRRNLDAYIVDARQKLYSHPGGAGEVAAEVDSRERAPQPAATEGSCRRVWGCTKIRKLLAPETVDRHRATASLGEELEAIDWYDQRVDATQDEELRTILAHNRDEEKEHAAMTLEWLRRHDPEVRRGAAHVPLHRGIDRGPGGRRRRGGGHERRPPGDGSLGIGSLKR